MKSLLVALCIAFSSIAVAHQHGAKHLTFANGAYHAHLEWQATPQVGVESILKIQWRRGSDHAPIPAPGNLVVEPYMCHGTKCHGTSETLVVEDPSGTVGAYLAKEIFFSMNGPWEIRLNLTYPDKSLETQSFNENVGQQHGGHQH